MSTTTLVDAIAGDAHNIPAGSPVAGYLTGQGVAWTTADWDRFTAARVRILQQSTTNEAIVLQADVIDVENGALTLTGAAVIARQRLAYKLDTTVYIEASRLTSARKQLAGIAGITYWVANWNLTAKEADALITGDVVAIQYGSPDGGINAGEKLPDTKLTIKQANVDLSQASETWLAKIAARWPKPKPAATKKTVAKPHPKTVAGTVGAAAVAGATAYANKHGWHLTGAEGTILTATGAFITATLTPAKPKT